MGGIEDLLRATYLNGEAWNNQNHVINLNVLKTKIPEANKTPRATIDSYITSGSISSDGVIDNKDEFEYFLDVWGNIDGDGIISTLQNSPRSPEIAQEIVIRTALGITKETNGNWAINDSAVKALSVKPTEQAQQAQNPNTSAPSALIVKEKEEEGGNPEIKYIQIETLSLNEFQDYLWFKLGDKAVSWPKERFVKNGLVPLDLFMDFDSGSIDLSGKTLQIASNDNATTPPDENAFSTPIALDSNFQTTAPESAINLGSENFAAANNAITLPEGIKNSLGRSLKKLTNYAPTSEISLKVMNQNTEVEGLDYNPDTKTFVNKTNREINIPANTELTMTFTNSQNQGQTITLTGKVGEEINLTPPQNENTQEITDKASYIANYKSDIQSLLGLNAEPTISEDIQNNLYAAAEKAKGTNSNWKSPSEIIADQTAPFGARLQASIALKQIAMGAGDKKDAALNKLKALETKGFIDVALVSGNDPINYETTIKYINGEANGGLKGANDTPFVYKGTNQPQLIQAVQVLNDSNSSAEEIAKNWISIYGSQGILRGVRTDEQFKRFTLKYMLTNVPENLDLNNLNIELGESKPNNNKIQISGTDCTLSGPSWAGDKQEEVAYQILKMVFSQNKFGQTDNPEGEEQATNINIEYQPTQTVLRQPQQPTITITNA